LKEEALDRSLWRTGFVRGCGPILRQAAEWMNDLTVGQIFLWKCLSAVSTSSTERNWLSVQVGRTAFRLRRGTLKPRTKIMRIVCVLSYLEWNSKVVRLRVTSFAAACDKLCDCVWQVVRLRVTSCATACDKLCDCVWQVVRLRVTSCATACNKLCDCV
jgi:hypothetical protein